MVIVQLIGGLGNQMFQYACAKSVSIRNNVRLILDVSIYSQNIEALTPRVFELSAFNINADILSNQIISESQKKELDYYTEDSWCKYDKDIECIESPCYLAGYWQSWKYFNHISALIRSDFSFNESQLSSSVIKLGEILSNSPSVSIHIRRTDYLQYTFIQVTPIQYYKKAIEYLCDRIPMLTFYVFSDDANWVKNHLDIPVQFCVIEKNTGIEDMYLMSHCRYNIIANSTFSWWAAWLNCFSEKIVIAPQVWGVGSDRSDCDVTKTDIIPPSWVCLY